MANALDAAASSRRLAHGVERRGRHEVGEVVAHARQGGALNQLDGHQTAPGRFTSRRAMLPVPVSDWRRRNWLPACLISEPVVALGAGVGELAAVGRRGARRVDVERPAEPRAVHECRLRGEDPSTLTYARPRMSTGTVSPIW